LNTKQSKTINADKTYLNAPSRTVRRKIGGKEYLVRSFFTGEKKLDEVITKLAIQRVYDELECNATITNGKENRFGLGGKK
jgi:hypothetical protein